MKIFSLVAMGVSLINVFFGLIEGNILIILSSLCAGVGFGFLFFYYQNESRRLMNLFAVFLAFYVVFILIRMYTEKGYF